VDSTPPLEAEGRIAGFESGVRLAGTRIVLGRIRSIWRPEAYHGDRLGAGWFEGWFFKVTDSARSRTLAFIPGVFFGKTPEETHAFVQVLDGRTRESKYFRYPIGAFRASERTLDVSVGPNRFTPGALELDFRSLGTDLHGRVEFGPFRPWPNRWFSPGVMGPYAFAPFMECYHGVLSLDHSLHGGLIVDGRPVDFSEGRGYIEKDWGRSFPSGYVWIQSNHFASPGAGLMVSVAKIPWLGGSFRGFLAGFLLNGTLHAFTTYNRSVLESCRITDREVSLSIRGRKHSLEIDAEQGAAGSLAAPDGVAMRVRIAETLGARVRVRLLRTRDGATLFEGTGDPAAMDMHGTAKQIA
jgi:tocopherol cyclase